MRRLRVSTWALAAILVAIVARMIASGPALVTKLTASFIALLLIAAILLTRHGRRLEPRLASRQTRYRG